MTEKRFTFHHDVDGVDYIKDESNGFCLICDELMCSLLNKLHSRNKRLEEKIQRERTSFMKTHERWSKEAENKIKELAEDNEKLKKELKVYRKIASCSNCRYHDYDWDINDGCGGEEYEVCDKGNDVTDGICEGWEEF